MCTYGYWEKRDLRDVLDTVGPGPIVLVGTSLGAAVALQEAPDDPRVEGVVAAEAFSDLRTVARERAPRFLTETMIRRAFSIAEARGGSRADEVSPMAAARRIRIPVLPIHGALDADTPPDHSRRILAALRAPKELILIEGARHNESFAARSFRAGDEITVQKGLGLARCQVPGIFGQSQQIMDPGPKPIYLYRDLGVAFLTGRDDDLG